MKVSKSNVLTAPVSRGSALNLKKAAQMLFVAIAIFAGNSAMARRNTDYGNGRGNQWNPRNPSYGQPGVQATDDGDLVRAVNDKRNVHFVEAVGVTVVQILPDDTQGSPHQKWVIQLSSGAKVLAVYNSDMGSRVPVKIGQKIGIGGEFKMTNIGPLIHWLHFDPRKSRPDGYVEIDGVRYGSK